MSDMFSYLDWLKTNFGKEEIASSREQVWKTISREFEENEKVVAIELGVAHGYATQYWLSNLDQNIVEWNGFDTFQGLPRPWRNFEIGTFSNGGTPPMITDKRLSWHVGKVEETLPIFLFSKRIFDQVWLILFDLDLFEPTVESWQLLEEKIMPGDYLYFDEAFDQGERKVLNDLVLPNFKTTFIAASAGSLAIRIDSRVRHN